MSAKFSSSCSGVSFGPVCMDDLVQPNAKQGKFREHSIKSLLFLIANSLQLAVESREREHEDHEGKDGDHGFRPRKEHFVFAGTR